MVDATPDCSCLEQETFIFRYLKRINDTYSIEERFYTFIQNNGTTGEEIANMIFNFLEKVNVPLEDCLGQGYDNAAAMSGAYKGVQSRLLQKNPLILYSPCVIL